MINLGFSTDDLAKYNSSTVYKSVFNGIKLTTDQQQNLQKTSTGLNAYTKNPKKSTTLLFMGGKLPANLAGYEGLIALFKAIAEARKGFSTQKTDSNRDSNNASDAPLKWGDSSTSNTSIFEGTELPILKDTSNIFSPPTTPTTVDPPAPTPPAQPPAPTPPAQPPASTPPPPPAQPSAPQVVVVEKIVEKIIPPPPPPPPPPPQPIVFSGAGGDGKTQYQGVQTADGQRQDIYWRDANNQVLYSSVRTKNSDGTWTDVKKDQAGNVTTSKYDANFKPI